MFCKSIPGLVLLFSIFLHNIFSGDDAWRLSKDSAAGSGKQRKDDHRFKSWLKICNSFCFISRRMENSPRLWQFSYPLTLFLSLFYCAKSCFCFFSPSCEAKRVWQEQKAQERECQQPMKRSVVAETESPTLFIYIISSSAGARWNKASSILIAHYQPHLI